MASKEIEITSWLDLWRAFNKEPHRYKFDKLKIKIIDEAEETSKILQFFDVGSVNIVDEISHYTPADDFLNLEHIDALSLSAPFKLDVEIRIVGWKCFIKIPDGSRALRYIRKDDIFDATAFLPKNIPIPDGYMRVKADSGKHINWNGEKIHTVKKSNFREIREKFAEDFKYNYPVYENISVTDWTNYEIFRNSHKSWVRLRDKRVIYLIERFFNSAIAVDSVMRFGNSYWINPECRKTWSWFFSKNTEPFDRLNKRDLNFVKDALLHFSEEDLAKYRNSPKADADIYSIIEEAIKDRVQLKRYLISKNLT